MEEEKKLKLFTVMWASYLPLLREEAQMMGLEMVSFSTKLLNREPRRTEEAAAAMEDADLVLLYRTNDHFWEVLDKTIGRIRERVPIVVVGSDPSSWPLSSVGPDTVAAVNSYLLYNGRENMANMLRRLLKVALGREVVYDDPRELPWQGIYHPGMGTLFTSTREYIDAYRRFLSRPVAAYVGLLYPRTNWATGNLDVERCLIGELEKRSIGVIPVFLYALKDRYLGNMGGIEAIRAFLLGEDGMPVVDGIVKLTAFFLGAPSGGSSDEDAASASTALLKDLNVPLFGPVISYYQSKEEWKDDPRGLGAQVAWSIAMPEFEGVIEPLVVGATRGLADPEGDAYEAVEERAARIAGRIARWIALRKKRNGEKKIAIILHNNPCASVEATVGGGAHLDTLESVADLLKRLEREGYDVQPFADGKALIEEIMTRKALSEFRWTTVEEIVRKGGALALLPADLYRCWFDALTIETQRRMATAWGEPPGEERNGIPAAMVYEGKIVITGVARGNVVICVQPKRGCAGARCDGQVCRILHDPDVPPPHQYLATYWWLAREFQADVLIHVGTHGNLEFLPGKATGLSATCFPDLAIDEIPHLYIYNADNPPEGTVAKRRSNAVLIDHLQTVMVKGGLYGDLERLEILLEEYGRYRQTEPARAHAVGHLIMDAITGLQLWDDDASLHDCLDEKIPEIHDRLSVMKNSFISKGMHIFGRRPEGDDLAAFVYAIARFDTDPSSLRGTVREVMTRETPRQDEAIAEAVDEVAERICRKYVLETTSLSEGLADCFPLNAEDEVRLRKAQADLEGIIRSVHASDEMGALLNGLGGGFIPPGPSGLVTRGRRDVLPTGRNFYSLDPRRIPSPSAWETGKTLAMKTIDKYRGEEGRFPENIAFYWPCTDIMWAEGEGLSQMLYLLGVMPEWGENGRYRRFRVLPLLELGRPRIDVTVRVSGITRDNFPDAVAMLDHAIRTVADLDEPLEWNFVRKHTLAKLNGRRGAGDIRQATYRIFASKPGTYQAGTQLAVYASAWKTPEDLSDVFLHWNGYAYGQDVFGEKARRSLETSLQTVDITFNKTVTDEYDLTGCCAHFGSHGGMINAARVLSRRDIKNYYGDTRDPAGVSVRTLTEEIRRVARAKILNPRWIEGMKGHGYRGAGEIGKRVGRIYGWQATTRAVDAAVLDDIARTYVMDPENRRFFEENNPWALEEMTRRLIEAAHRGIWKPSPDVDEALKVLYVDIEGWIEERMGDVWGDFQGGSIDVLTKEDVAMWKNKWEGEEG